MILFILDIEKQQKQLEKTAFFYLLVSLFCALFGGVYEYFSHEVYSNCMIYAFFIPLAGGTLPFLGMSLLHCPRVPGKLPRNLYHSGIAALTVGCLFQGVLDIYGTTNSLIRIYWIAGFGMAGLGLLLYFIGLFLSYPSLFPDDKSH